MSLCKSLVPRKTFLSLAVLGLSLAGCGGGGGDTAATVPVESTDVVISGSVGDGPIVGATVSIYGQDGTLIDKQVSDASANYRLRIKAQGKMYPLTVTAEGGTDLVTGGKPDFALVSVAAQPWVKNVNLNPFTTIVVETAQRMPGGLTLNNVDLARVAVDRHLNFGLDARVFPNPITTTVDNSNVAMIVKASEAVGEVIRRAHYALRAQESALSADKIIQRIASDLADGTLDGKGAAGTHLRTTAVVQMVSAQVLIESLSNNLRVGGVSATAALDDAIRSIQSGTSNDALSGSVLISGDMISQAKAMVNGARAVDPSVALRSISDALSRLTADSRAADVERILPADASQDLDGAITMAVAGGDAELAAIVTGTLSGVPQDPAANSAPTLSGTPATAVAEGSTYRFAPQAADADNDSLSFSIVNRPSWAAFDAATGRLTGTPQPTDVGTYSGITISVSDGQLSAGIGPFSIAVSNVNTAPTIGGTPTGTIQQGVAYRFVPTAADQDGDSLTFSISNKPTWATFNTSNGTLAGTPGAEHVGTTGNIVISVTDGVHTASMSPFSITVTAVAPANYPPQLSGTPAATVAEDSAYRFAPSASDRDGDPLTYTIANRPGWASFSTSTGVLSGTPRNTDVGTYTGITISVSDGTAAATIGPFSITVTNVNDPPTITGAPATTVAEDSTYRFAPVASDPDGDSLTFSIANRPTWATFNATTGVLSGTPRNANVGTVSGIVITVSDGSSTASVGPFSITVTNTNDAPTITGTPATQVAAGSAYSFRPSAADLDGDSLTFRITNRPAWATFNTATGQLTGTPSATHVGTTGNIVISVSDGTVTTALPAFSITVNSVTTSGSARLSWSAPTQRADGTALGINDIGGYRIRYGNAPASYSNSVDISSAYTTEHTIADLAPGTWYFVVTCYDTQSNESQISNVMTKTIQ